MDGSNAISHPTSAVAFLIVRLDAERVKPVERSEVEGAGGSRAEKIVYPPNKRLTRIRFMGVLLDECIVLPGGFKVGLDPIVGLIPGVGDFIGTLLSCFIVYDAARLGVPGLVLMRMMANVSMEFLFGLIPFLGDIFDAVWKANRRNIRLVETVYSPRLKERSLFAVLSTIGLVIFAFLAVVIGVCVWVWRIFAAAIASIF